MNRVTQDDNNQWHNVGHIFHHSSAMCVPGWRVLLTQRVQYHQEPVLVNLECGTFSSGIR